MFEIIIGIGIDSEALSTKMQVILKKYDFFYPDFFRLNIILCSHSECETQIKKGGHSSCFLAERQQRDNFGFK